MATTPAEVMTPTSSPICWNRGRRAQDEAGLQVLGGVARDR